MCVVLRCSCLALSYIKHRIFVVDVNSIKESDIHVWNIFISVFRELDDWVRWISDVYRRTTTDLERLDIQLQLPGWLSNYFILFCLNTLFALSFLCWCLLRTGGPKACYMNIIILPLRPEVERWDKSSTYLYVRFHPILPLYWLWNLTLEIILFS